MCPVCGFEAKDAQRIGDVQEIDCPFCGRFAIARQTIADFNLPFRELKQKAVARYNARKIQHSEKQSPPMLDANFFSALRTRSLPSPAELLDNTILWMAEKADGSPGTQIEITYSDPELLGKIGAVRPGDIEWATGSLLSQNLLTGPGVRGAEQCPACLTPAGWQRVEELKKAHVASAFAFFARQFHNTDLDEVFERCLRPAVAETGYELRTVTQKPGLIDAIIEDEIRRSKFLVADLSDDNAGAYWEAGFAEGLGKPVVYLCRAKAGEAEKKTHFDTDHRHTVRWDLGSLDDTARSLKAVIRNALLGDARQTE